MSSTFRTAGVVAVVLAPGGLVLLLAWVLARTIVTQMRREDGPAMRRFSRAVVSVRWPAVYQSARATQRLRRLRGS
jgi:hypothetical protein